jgi:hypothetical protein
MKTLTIALATTVSIFSSLTSFSQSVSILADACGYKWVKTKGSSFNLSDLDGGKTVGAREYFEVVVYAPSKSRRDRVASLQQTLMYLHQNDSIARFFSGSYDRILCLGTSVHSTNTTLYAVIDISKREISLVPTEKLFGGPRTIYLKIVE